nr:hypothetical protein [Tanacetum cinerariifolium]
VQRSAVAEAGRAAAQVGVVGSRNDAVAVGVRVAHVAGLGAGLHQRPHPSGVGIGVGINLALVVKHALGLQAVVKRDFAAHVGEGGVADLGQHAAGRDGGAAAQAGHYVVDFREAGRGRTVEDVNLVAVCPRGVAVVGGGILVAHFAVAGPQLQHRYEADVL